MPAVPQTSHVHSVQLLEAVMRFTAERNREALASVLLKTILEALPIAAIELHPSQPVSNAPPLRLEREAADAPPLTPEARQRLQQDLAACQQQLSDAGSPDAGLQSILAPEYSLHLLNDVQGVGGIVAIEHQSGQTVDPHLVAAFLKIYGNFASVLDESHRDTLTGLLNRKTFEESIQGALLEARDAGHRPLGKADLRQAVGPDACHWLAVIDIDHFKRVNDTFGHLYGDEVLLLLARLMQQCFRRADRVYRFGGEEFAVLLNPCTLASAKMVLDRFRLQTQNYNFPQVGQVTVSIGFVAVRHQDIPSTVVGHADEALYASKHNGRNRVTFYEDLDNKKGPAAEQSSSIDLF